MVVFVAKVLAPVKGIERGKLLLHPSRERGHFFRVHYACLSKVVVLVAKVLAPVRGIEEGKLFSLRLRERGGTFSGLTLLA